MPGAIGAQPMPKLSALAGKPAPKEMLIDVARNSSANIFEVPPRRWAIPTRW